MRTFVALSLLLVACGSSASSDDTPSGGSPGSSSPGGGCPALAATWTITAHCVSSFVGQTVTVTQSSCALTFAAPFDGYSGTVASDGTLSVTGPTVNGTQHCTGTAAASSISLSCPGPCAVSLTR